MYSLYSADCLLWIRIFKYTIDTFILTFSYFIMDIVVPAIFGAIILCILVIILSLVEMYHAYCNNKNSEVGAAAFAFCLLFATSSNSNTFSREQNKDSLWFKVIWILKFFSCLSTSLYIMYGPVSSCQWMIIINKI